LQERGIALDPTLIIDTAYIHFDIDAPLRLERCGEVTRNYLPYTTRRRPGCLPV
jgi:hypothetical protein